MNKLTVLLLGLIVVTTSLLISGCNSAEGALGGSNNPAIGRGCVVHFRGDALGAAKDLPTPPLSSSIDGAETTVGGKLKQVTDDWIVIEHPERGELWVARSAVLLLSMGVSPGASRSK